MTTQLKLAGIPAPEPHANRGRQFEAMLEATHDLYLRTHVGFVEKISNALAFCTEGAWRKLPDELKARTGDGRPLRRVRTCCDYIGQVFSFGVAFDAKEFAGTSFPLVNVKSHQALALYNFWRTGGLAGFLILAKRVDKVYWISAESMMRLNSTGTLKSLNIKWLDENATLITERASHATIDWARVLLKPRAA